MRGPSAATRFLYTALAATVFAYAIVVINAYARLSESPESSVPRTALVSTAAARAQLVSRASREPTWSGYAERPWQQKVHPFLAGALALIVARLGYLAWQRAPRRITRELLVSASVLVLLWAVALPDVHAALALLPWAQLLQLASTLVVLSLLWWLVLREQEFWRSAEEGAFVRALRPRALVALALVALQAALGAWSNVIHAGLPCVDFPTCNGQWWPPVDLADAFVSPRLTQSLAAGEARDAALEIHLLHRLGGLITLLYVGWLALHVFWRGIEGGLCRYGLLIALALLLQTSLGIMAVVTGLPTATAVVHSAIGALLLLAVLTLYHAVRPPRLRSPTTTTNAT